MSGLMWVVVLCSILSVGVLAGAVKGAKVLGEKKKYRELESKGVADWSKLSKTAKKLLGLCSEYYGNNDSYYSTLNKDMVMKHLRSDLIWFPFSLVEIWACEDYDNMLKLWAKTNNHTDLASHRGHRHPSEYFDTSDLVFKRKEGEIRSWSDFAVHSIRIRKSWESMFEKLDYSELSDEEWDRVIERYLWKFFSLWEDDYHAKEKAESAAKRNEKYAKKLAYTSKAKLEMTPSTHTESDNEDEQWDETFQELDAAKSED